MRPNAEKQKIFADNADICICDSMGTFFFQKDVKAAEKTGTVTFSIERFTIGQGYLIEPCQVDIYDTDNIASVVDRVLTQEGYGYENKGKIQDGFYS